MLRPLYKARCGRGKASLGISMQQGISPYTHTKEAPVPHCALPHTKDRATTPPPRPPGLVVPVPPAKPQRRKRPDYNSQQPPRPSPAPLPPSWLRSEPPFSLPPPNLSHRRRHHARTPWSRLFVSALRPDARSLPSNTGRVGKPEAETQGEISPYPELRECPP
ncbi:unnamed protein product [Pipistrellus nathusii]|uniref:Uncharacterized protein n=1 Tax=Pipistrellus nathusii TaxID=59473 RepID=A0ABN9ZLH2_PIPNA